VRPVDPRLLRRARAARGYLAVATCLGLATTALILLQASLVARLLAGAAPGTGTSALGGMLVVLFSVVVLRAVFCYGGESAALRAASAVKSQLRRAVATHALRLGPAWIGGQRPGELATLTTKGLDALDAYFARYLPQLVLACVVPAAVLVRVAVADWISALVIAVTVPLVPVFAVLVGLHTKAQTQRQWNLLARLGGHFLDVVEGLPTLKIFGRAAAQEQVIAEVTSQHRVATMRTLRTAFLSALVLELAATLATAVVAVEVGLRLLDGNLSYQTALLVLLLTPEAYLPLRAVGLHFHASQEGSAAAAQALDILELPLPAEPADVAGAAWPDLRRDAITLHDVWLHYPGRELPVLRGASLQVRPGEVIAISGASGAGKSSLLAMLLRFAEPTKGRIEAGGIPIGQVPPGLWREQIAWVPQLPYLFAGTVADNIALGNRQASRSQVVGAAVAAGADAFISALPAGYDTEIGERGCTLSSGQRQRIAVARAFLRNAPLLLLDEPTSHLDRPTARELTATITSLMAGRTVLLVTHDADLAAAAGRQVILAGGRLVQVTGPAAEVRPARHCPALAGAGSIQ
jgi:ATP-binding cassette, subfamily C, bacterial CydD